MILLLLISGIILVIADYSYIGLVLCIPAIFCVIKGIFTGHWSFYYQCDDKEYYYDNKKKAKI